MAQVELFVQDPENGVGGISDSLVRKAKSYAEVYLEKIGKGLILSERHIRALFEEKVAEKFFSLAKSVPYIEAGYRVALTLGSVGS